MLISSLSLPSLITVYPITYQIWQVRKGNKICMSSGKLEVRKVRGKRSRQIKSLEFPWSEGNTINFIMHPINLFCSMAWELILSAVRLVHAFLSQPWHVLFLARFQRIYEGPEDIDWEDRLRNTMREQKEWNTRSNSVGKGFYGNMSGFPYSRVSFSLVVMKWIIIK